jgi:hypothetical protein
MTFVECLTKKRSLSDLVHIVVIVAVLTSAFWPLSTLKRGAFAISFLLTLGWVVFSGCVLMPYDAKSGKRREFIYPLLQECLPNLDQSKYHNILTCALVGIPTIIVMRLLFSKM